MNGRLVEFEKATTHVMSHALHYGSGVFEGIRCYNTRRGPEVFRLSEHIRRLELSAKVYRMDLPVPAAEFAEAVLETIRANGFDSCYVRPLVYRGFGTMGVNPLRSPVDAVIAVWPWGKYLGDASEGGVDVCVSSWRRPSSEALPAIAKATGNYLSSQLIKIEAITNGYVEGIALDSGGYVSEGSGENLFLVRDGVLVTPPLAASLLHGITRDTVMTLAREQGIEVREEMVSRAQLYTCDELFLTGTAAEITPVSSVDRYAVGAGCPGPVTSRILKAFQAVITGEAEDRHGWMTPVGKVSVEPELSPAEASTSA
ncbi:MAG: branched-chain amino acid transaminase [Acidobacteriota bacterium]